jgi:magnesium transporter
MDHPAISPIPLRSLRDPFAQQRNRLLGGSGVTLKRGASVVACDSSGMNVAAGIPDFNAPVVEHARKDFPLLDAGRTVAEALECIRREGVGERVIYFYAVDEQQRLVGVVPTRRLLTAPLDTPLRGIMVQRVIAIPANATVLDACEFFVLYKFLAFPVVDKQRRVIGIIDANLFAEEILEAGEREDRHRPAAPVRDDFFEALGFHLEQIRGASPLRVFRLRFPWLLVTVVGGTVCAILAGFFETTLAHALVIAFFLTMVLGLNESVSTQSMSVTIQALRSAPVTWRWFVTAFRREVMTALLIGFACGILVGVIVWVWRTDVRGAFVIGGSIALSLVTASLFGLGVPSLLHHFKLDPKIAAGPVTLALADFSALVFYFTSAWLVFG